MQKKVLKPDMHDEKDKEKAVKIVSGIGGVDMEENKLTVTGAIDTTEIVSMDIISVGPAEEAQKDNNRSNKKEQSEDSTFDPAEGNRLPYDIFHYKMQRPFREVPNIKARVPPPLYRYGRYVTGEKGLLVYACYEPEPALCVIC